MIWLTSDLHLGHDKDFVWGARGFQSVDEMNRVIIEHLNEVVMPDDDLYILGDLILGNIEEGKKLLRRIPGKVHVILGNHDSAAKIAYYESLGWDCQWGLLTKIGGYSVLLSHWPTLTSNFDLKPLKREVINFHGHTHQECNFTDNQFCMYHVGMDSHNCYPVAFDDAMDDIIKDRKKEGKPV